MSTSIKTLEDYYATLVEKHKTGQAREHAYRPVLERLIQKMDESLKILNDPSRSEHGNPDFVFLKGDITVGYAETKDIGIDLDKTERSDQMQRYLGYSNLILTDYLEFRFFRNGLRYEEPIRIADIQNGQLVAHPDQYERLQNAISDFLHGEAEPIKNGKHLAEIMGGKARRIRDNVLDIIDGEKVTDVHKVYETMRNLLVHDMTKESFADMYAQTLVYGLFVARYSDETPKTFSRAEARDLVPASNPFLAHFFDHIAGVNFEKRLGYIVDELCEVFRHADVKELMSQYFGKTLWGDDTEGPDPVIHFYEDFLKEYDPTLRKKMGAYYTPTPVVRFIVRSVDKLLEKDFNLARGLADTSKYENGLHKVQVLDPATGTGTFTSAIIRRIYERIKENKQEGSWPAYVHHDLLPRIHAFELMMGPYTIAHLKLSMAFKKTGFWNFHRRLNIFLTNSLEESVPQDSMFSGFGFAESIAEESKEAAKIKNDTPVMVVVGNPPYSGESFNKGDWIMSLMEDYKKEPGGKERLDERNPKWLNDDYVKFIRYAQHYVENNNTGIIAYINPHGFLDNPTFRGMRWNLLKTFDEIYTLDLHGNAKKKETAPDGGKDENVFDIQQGVSINIFVKTNKKQKDVLGKIYHYDLYGKRKEKFAFLLDNVTDTVDFTQLEPQAPNYFFVPKDLSSQTDYEKGFKISKLFNTSSAGIVTARDALTINDTFDEVRQLVNNFVQLNSEDARTKYQLGKDVRDWKVALAQEDLRNSGVSDKNITKISYRLFDTRWTYYTGKSKGFHCMPRGDVMQNFINGDNLGLALCKQFKTGNTYQHAFVSDKIMESSFVSNRTSEITSLFPLYTYDTNTGKETNLNTDIVSEIMNITGEVTPENIFDYIYAVLHSPRYREKYKEFLKIDFPHIPYPKNSESFHKLAKLGQELRELHLMQSSKLNNFTTSYPAVGENEVEKITYKDGNVYINNEQYFGDIPEVAWNFQIGGYQPAQKWLKDRKGRKLTNEDIEHYQKIIVALVETDRIMKEIDKLVT